MAFLFLSTAQPYPPNPRCNAGTEQAMIYAGIPAKLWQSALIGGNIMWVGFRSPVGVICVGVPQGSLLGRLKCCFMPCRARVLSYFARNNAWEMFLYSFCWA